MNTLQAIVLGIVQGLTEFLPVSSSGHLQLAKELMGVSIPDNNVTFDVMLHAATVCSTIVVLWHELRRLLLGLFSRRFNDEQAYVLKILISMVPAGIVGVFFSKQIEQFFSSLGFVGAMLLVTAALLAFAYYAKPRPREAISYRDALLIGVAQAAATMPGLSRSGSTIATGLLLGNSKQSVAHFSFLMVIPVILGKMFLDLVTGKIEALGLSWVAMASGFAAAFITGAFACKFMIDIVKRGKLIWFAAYCAVAGIVSLTAYLLR